MSYTYYVFGELILPASVNSNVMKYLESAQLEQTFEVHKGKAPNTIAVTQTDSGSTEDVDGFYDAAARWLKGTELDGQEFEFDYDGQSYGTKLLSGGQSVDFDVGNLMIVDADAINSPKQAGERFLVLVEAKVVKLHSGRYAVLDLSRYIPRKAGMKLLTDEPNRGGAEPKKQRKIRGTPIDAKTVKQEE